MHKIKSMGWRSSLLTIALSLSLMLPAQLAHADFRRALDAYFAKNGQAMLSEVQDAVNNKNDDGINLFIDSLIIDNQEIKQFQDLKASSNQAELAIVLNKIQTEKLFALLEFFQNRMIRMRFVSYISSIHSMKKLDL